MIRNSLRQLFRTKIKTILFFVLIALCALLICLGSNLVRQCQKNLKHFKDVFVTIGTVEQKPITVQRVPVYDAETGQYTYVNRKEYGKAFSISELDLEGVEYITKPERRPFYQVEVPGYKIIEDNAGWTNDFLVEASPVHDCVPNGPVEMKMKKVLFSIYKQTVDEFYYCDHNNPHPDKLYKDKTYVMCLCGRAPHGFSIGNPENNPHESIPVRGPYSEQTDAEGNALPTLLTGESVEEINAEYYAKGHDKLWEAYAREYDMLYKMIPVTPIADLNLIMAFYDNDAVIKDGKTFSEEDYEKGNNVCLVSARFTRRNKLKIGDKIPLRFRMANYSTSANAGYYINPLTAEGNNFEEFYEADYTIIGTYEIMPGGTSDFGYQLADNEVFIPDKSIKADNSNNIGVYGNSVSPYNTSFRITNGTADDFMKALEAKGIDNVEIHFYDKGYSKLEDGILQMERMAYFLLAAGVIMAVLVLIFFCHMMIGGQKKRTAIERSLGVCRSKCMTSLLSGILLVAAVGCIIGCTGGYLLTEVTADTMTQQSMYSDDYSAGSVSDESAESSSKADSSKKYGADSTDSADSTNKDDTDATDSVDSYNSVMSQFNVTVNGELTMTVLAFISLFCFTILVSGITAWRNLKVEPLELLSGENR